MKRYLLAAILLGLFSNTQSTFKFVHADDDKDLKVRAMTDASVAVTIVSLIRAVVNLNRIPISSKVIIYFIGLTFGLFVKYIIGTYLQDYVHVLYVLPPSTILSAMMPILVFKVSFCIDSHSFLRAWIQIVLISIPGLLMTMTFVGFLAMAILNAKWNWTVSMGMAFGVVCTPIYPDEVIRLLKEIEKSKYLNILLEGECMIGTGCAVVLFQILVGNIQAHIVTWYQFIMVFFRFFGGGMLLGVIVGKLSCLVAGRLYNDPICMMSVTIASSCLSYYVCVDVLGVSGVICVAIIGVMLSVERSSLSSEVDVFLVSNWELMAYLTDAVLFLMFGIISVTIFSQKARIGDYALVFITYVLVNTGRFLSFIILAPVLSRVGYGLTFRNMTVVVWGGLKGSVTICLTMIVYTHPSFGNMSKDLTIHMIGLVILTLLINSSTMNLVLTVLGYFDLSMARKTNMNNCVRHVLNRRDRTIAMLKMDRFLADANWPTVNVATLFRHPYKISLNENDDDDEDDFYLGYRYTTCPDCQKEIAAEPSAKELVEMTREARMRILKAKKISYSRQYEDGMLTKDSFRILTQAVEVAMDTNEALMDIEGLRKLFHRQGLPHYIRKKLLQMYYAKKEDTLKPPRRYWHRYCYHIITHKAFEPFIYTVIVLNTIPITIELTMKPDPDTAESNLLASFNLLFFLIYLTEFYLKIYGYAYVYVCRHGFKTYFSSYWNIFDFIVLVIAFADCSLDFADMMPNVDFQKKGSSLGTVTTTARLVRTLRLVRLLRLCRSTYPKLIKCMDGNIDKHLGYAYDLGKGFVIGEREVSEMLIHMIDNKDIREEMRLKLESDKLAIMRELGIVQKEKPWIAITIKTKQAIMTVLNSMADAVYELKISGWVDDVENTKLMESLNTRFKQVRDVNKVEPSAPEVIFRQVPWMGTGDEVIEFLYANVRTKVFDPGDVICTRGRKSDGIYIILTGFFKLTYLPGEDILERVAKYGELPIVDYMTTTRFTDKFEDYIVSGNSVGELGVLTGRPYCCTIVSDTPSQAFVLSHQVMEEAIKRSSDPTQGLAARLWKCVSMRIALAVLLDVPAYQSYKLDKIKFMLERAFVPDLSRYKVFAINDMMQDLILVEGSVVDFQTRDEYLAPCYIPRTVQKMSLIKLNEDMRIETKLLIIPIPDVEDYEIMEVGEEMSEIVSTSSVRCIQHLIQQRAGRRRRKRKKAMQNYNARKRALSSQRGSKGNRDALVSRNSLEQDSSSDEEEYEML